MSAESSGEANPIELHQRTRDLIDSTLDQVSKVARELNELAFFADRDDPQLAHWLRHRADALLDGTSELAWHLVSTMSREQLRASLIAEGMDADAVMDRGVDFIRELSAKHRASKVPETGGDPCEG